MITSVIHRQLRLANGVMTPGLFNAMRSANLTQAESVKIMAAVGMDREGGTIAVRPIVAAMPLPAPPRAPATVQPVTKRLVPPRKAPQIIPSITTRANPALFTSLGLSTKTSTVLKTSKAPHLMKPPPSAVIVQNVVVRRKLRSCLT